MRKSIIEPPYAIMINVPEAFFQHEGKMKGDREAGFRQFYEAMGKEGFEDSCFYHFISCCPTHQVQYAYVCFRGKVQYKGIVVQYLKNQTVRLPGSFLPQSPRDWVVITGPVVKAPYDIAQRGFRGFRYCDEIF